MELDQIVKRLEWIEDERRRDKAALASLEERVLSVEGGIPALQQQVKQLAGEVARQSASLARFDQIESSLVQVRVDFNRNLEAIEKIRTEHERETDKVRRVELEGINKAVGEVRKGLDPIPDLKKGLQARMEEEFRLGRLIEEFERKVLEARRNDDEYKRNQRLIEERQGQDSKRLADMLGEVSALRKRVDEFRGKVDLTADQNRKIDARLGDLFNSEAERRQAQASFLEKQALIQVERERTWKEWLVRFEMVEKQASGLDAQLQALETTHRSVKRSQEGLDEVTQRIDRRINEITEMQRLTDDRFRQDWTSFKADDQKRWTNYTIGHEEQTRESARQFEKLGEHFIGIEDTVSELQEAIQQINEETQKRLQALVNLAHDYVTTYEKVFGRMG
jgi:chromosome segregation ATPase